MSAATGIRTSEADQTASASARSSTAAVHLDHVSKQFGKVMAVDDVDLEIREGEFFSLLGPSGSGKTTCLRMIAGFEKPTAGRVLLRGEDVTRRAPYERDVNTVFQDYALFPHMDVRRNVGYGMLVRRVPSAERDERVHDALCMVHLDAFAIASRPSSQVGNGNGLRSLERW